MSSATSLTLALRTVTREQGWLAVAVGAPVPAETAARVSTVATRPRMDPSVHRVTALEPKRRPRKLRVDAETHVEQLRPMGASDSFPLLIGGAKSVRAIRVDQ